MPSFGLAVYALDLDFAHVRASAACLQRRRFPAVPRRLRIYLNPSDSRAVVKKWLIFIRSCANLRPIDRRRGRHEGRLAGSIRKIPHDAQVRRISWVRGVGRPALAHSGLLVPLPNADRPPFLKSRHRNLALNGGAILLPCLRANKNAAQKGGVWIS